MFAAARVEGRATSHIASSLSVPVSSSQPALYKDALPSKAFC